MATLQVDDILDLVSGTLNRLGPPTLSSISADLQDYPVMRVWLKKDRILASGGIGFEHYLNARRLGAARHLGLLEQDDVNIGDHLKKIRIEWRHATTAWGMEVREAMMNRGEELRVNIIEPRRQNALIDLATILEERAWTIPGSATDEYPWSVPYWIVYNATAGFNGDLPSGFTSVGGIDPDVDAPNFKNYTDIYTNITPEDLVKKMRRAQKATMFKSPIGGNEEARIRRRIYLNLDTLLEFEEVARQQNDQLGFDVASSDGETTFKGLALEWVPQLDAIATADPVYMLDNHSFHPVVLKGDAFRETGPDKHPLMHNAVQSFIDLTYNYICKDRRRNALIAKADPVSG